MATIRHATISDSQVFKNMVQVQEESWKVELHGDEVQDMKIFWNNINKALMSKMNSPTGMTSYENLNKIYDPRLTLVPSGRTTPTIQNTCEGIYK